MKHAINELQALLDTWGGQKDDEWRLSLTQATLSLMDLDSGEWELREVSEQHRADMAETSREENANGGPEEQEVSMEHKDTGVPVIGHVVFAQEVDDDLGELDPSAACDLSKEGGCEACQ